MIDSIDSHELGHSGNLENEKIVPLNAHRRHEHDSPDHNRQLRGTNDDAQKIDITRQQLRTQDTSRIEKAEGQAAVRALTNINVAAHFLTRPQGAIIENPEEYIADIWKVAPTIDTLVHAYPQRTQQQDDEGHVAQVIALSETNLLGRKTVRIISYMHQHGRIIRIEELNGKGKLVRVVTMPVDSKDAEKLMHDGQIFSNSIEHNRNVLQTGKEEKNVKNDKPKPSQSQVYAIEAANILRLISQSFRKTQLGNKAQQDTVSEITALAA